MHADLGHVNMAVFVATIHKAFSANAMASSMKDGRAPVGIMQLQTGILLFPQTITCLLMHLETVIFALTYSVIKICMTTLSKLTHHY